MGSKMSNYIGKIKDDNYIKQQTAINNKTYHNTFKSIDLSENREVLSNKLIDEDTLER